LRVWAAGENGLDSHLDLAASQFLNQQLFVGAVVYVYQQLTPDHGQAAILGSNESRTRGIGPQIGYNFNVNGTQVYTNIRACWEFDSYRRLQGHSSLRHGEHSVVDAFREPTKLPVMILADTRLALSGVTVPDVRFPAFAMSCWRLHRCLLRRRISVVRIC
jgi:hypothetical protein